MALRASDVMETHVITVDPELPLLDAHRLFVEEEIHGAPVVDESGRVLGIVSSADLLRAVDEEQGSGSGRHPYFLGMFEEGGKLLLEGDLRARLEELTVADVMTPGGVTVGPDTGIEEVARRLRQHRIHRVPVVEGSQLAGIITTFDLLALIEKLPAGLEA